LKLATEIFNLEIRLL